MADATTLERIDAAIARIDAAALALRLRAERAEHRAFLLDTAAVETIARLDALIDGDR